MILDSEREAGYDLLSLLIHPNYILPLSAMFTVIQVSTSLSIPQIVSAFFTPLMTFVIFYISFVIPFAQNVLLIFSASKSLHIIQD